VRKVEPLPLETCYCFIQFRRAWARSRDVPLERGQTVQSRPPSGKLLEFSELPRSELFLFGSRTRFPSVLQTSVRNIQTSQSQNQLSYDWCFTAKQFVLAPGPLRPTTSFFQLNTYGYSPYVTSSLTRVWVCCLQLLLALASAIILGSESRCLTFKTAPTWRAWSPYLYPPTTGWPIRFYKRWIILPSWATLNFSRRITFSIELVHSSLLVPENNLPRIVSSVGMWGYFRTESQN
jgi:hypothetical protein